MQDYLAIRPLFGETMFFISTCICFCYCTLLAINYCLIEKLLLAGRLYYRAGGSYSLLVRPNLTLRINHLNAWVVDNFTTVGIFFYQPYYNVISLLGLKITHIHSVYYSAFCITEYFVRTMRGRPIILQLLICLFYLSQLNIISLKSPKITLELLFTTYYL